MSKKLAAKASLIQLPPLPSPAGAVGPAAGNGSSGTAHSAHTAGSGTGVAENCAPDTASKLKLLST